MATAGEFTWWRPNVLWDLKEALLFDADGDQLTFSADHRLIAADREFIAINPALNAH